MGVLTRSKKKEMRASSRIKKHETRQSAFLKVVHPRGYVEIFREPITAGEIMRRYPRHCVTRPDFFEYPWIVVRPESVLVPGKVFFLVPHKTVDRVLKEKKQEIQSMNLRKDQSAKQSNHYQKVSPTDQQEDRYHRSQTNHQHHRGYKESYGNGREEQDSDDGSLYKSSFYESWNEMQRRIHQPHQETCLYVDSELDSPLHDGRPNVASPEQVELQRVKSCLRKGDSDRKKLNLKVSFASPVVIPGSWSGSPSVQQDDLVLQV